MRKLTDRPTSDAARVDLGRCADHAAELAALALAGHLAALGLHGGRPSPAGSALAALAGLVADQAAELAEALQGIATNGPHVRAE